VKVVGRILNLEKEKNLNLDSMSLLNVSDDIEGVSKISLNLSSLDGYFIFESQVLGLQGYNDMNKSFAALNLLPPTLPPSITYKHSYIDSMQTLCVIPIYHFLLKKSHFLSLSLESE
jgi:hypothetical protein